mmetsp:Transcript_5435/g.16003  ORF Transcript_5435/g.16003 Transcript_5435/m.16003 type:complete len:100 (-) Transcript_5435:643-942(-)
MQDRGSGSQFTLSPPTTKARWAPPDTPTNEQQHRGDGGRPVHTSRLQRTCSLFATRGRFVLAAAKLPDEDGSSRDASLASEVKTCTSLVIQVSVPSSWA